MTIKARMNKINQVANAKTTRLIFSNDMRRVYHVDSTRNGAPFQVRVDWSKGSELTAEVSLYVFDHKEQVNDKGNHQADFSRSLCYQVLGALKFDTKQVGKVLILPENKANAERLLRFGGELVRINNLGSGVVWGIVR